MTRAPRCIDRLARVWVGATLFALACVSPPPPETDSTVVWGFVRLVPKAGAEAGGGGYGDRRLADVRRVDYSEMKFAVVFAPEDALEHAEPATLSIRVRGGSLRLDPPFAATSPGAGIRVTNESGTSQIVSIPESARVERLAPGETRSIDGLQPGELEVHLLGIHTTRPPTPARIWVTEGPTAIADASGRYELRGLAPGPHVIRAWHPRLPPSPAHRLLLETGTVVRHDVEIGLDAKPFGSPEIAP